MFGRSALTSIARPLGTRAFSASTASRTATMTIVGRLTAEPELVNTSSGKDLVRYSVATNYGPSENRQTSFFRIASFEEGDRRNYLLTVPKGSLVCVVADARMSNYQSEDGSNKSSLSLVQNKLSVISRPRPAEGQVDEPILATGSG